MGRPRKQFSLVRTFLAPLVLSLSELCDRLGCSRATILRRLTEHGYYSSYNQRGKFFTIDEVARFDSRGLWACKGARFSKLGTLKNTLLHFVNTSSQGMTHDELAPLLGLRVHDTLLHLVKKGEIQRQRLGSRLVYFSAKRSVHGRQKRRRKEVLSRRPKSRPTARQKIAVFLQLIQDPKVSRRDIARRCRRAGVDITRELVNAIFEEYDLEKKKGA